MLPAPKRNGVGLHDLSDFGAQYTAHTIPVYASRADHPATRHTRFRLFGQPWPDGLIPQGHVGGFSSVVSYITSSTASLGLAHSGLRTFFNLVE